MFFVKPAPPLSIPDINIDDGGKRGYSGTFRRNSQNDMLDPLNVFTGFWIANGKTRGLFRELHTEGNAKPGLLDQIAGEGLLKLLGAFPGPHSSYFTASGVEVLNGRAGPRAKLGKWGKIWPVYLVRYQWYPLKGPHNWNYLTKPYVALTPEDRIPSKIPT